MMSKGLTNQRKSLLKIFVLVSILITSCSKDATEVSVNPEGLSGTSWKCSEGPYWDGELEYLLLIFTSDTMVEGWVKFVDEREYKDWEGSFFVSADQIAISFSYGSYTGTINENKMSLIVDGETYLFFKE